MCPNASPSPWCGPGFLFVHAKSLGEQFLDQSHRFPSPKKQVPKKHVPKSGGVTDPVLFKFNTRCHSCNNQIVKDHSKRTAAISHRRVFHSAIQQRSVSGQRPNPTAVETGPWPLVLADPRRNRLLPLGLRVVPETGNLTRL